MKNENEKELLKIKSVFSLKYILIEKLMELYFIFGLIIAFCIASKKILYGILAMIVLIVIVFTKLVWEKRRVNQTVMKFYDDRVEFKGKILCFHVKPRVLKYNEIKDITYTQGASFFEKRFQKAFGFGNIYVYPKKGNIYTKGMPIELVANIEEIVGKIKMIVGDKIG